MATTLSKCIDIDTTYRYRYLANGVELCADRERASATLPMSTAGMENSCDGVLSSFDFGGAALPCRFGAHFSCREKKYPFDHCPPNLPPPSEKDRSATSGFHDAIRHHNPFICRQTHPLPNHLGGLTHYRTEPTVDSKCR